LIEADFLDGRATRVSLASVWHVLNTFILFFTIWSYPTTLLGFIVRFDAGLEIIGLLAILDG
jgi:hypothetical protein